MPRNPPPAEMRLWAMVDIRGADECWPWQGSVLKGGYGQIKDKGVLKQTHRLAYELENGPVPEGQLVCHSCDNPPCCNPAHLWAGTPGQNMEDMVYKGRGKHPVGESHINSKLSDSEVRAIRKLRSGDNPMPYSTMEVLFGVSRSTLCNIANGKERQHVTEE